jgi:ATP-dependent exoDNAse (exonuclease V) beta subunit
VAQLDLWLALKSPLFACGDDDLLRHRQAGGGWSLFVDQPEGRVGTAMSLLRELTRRWPSPRPTDVMDALITETRIMEALAFTPRGAFDADCLRMIQAHARSWQDEGGIGLADYRDALNDLRQDGSRVSLSEPDDRDDNAVRLMTVYQAKGLEFPIVALTGMSRQVHDPDPQLGIRSPDNIVFNLGGGLTSRGYADWTDEVRQPAAAAERMRVAYVACTRARDHLIVSMCGEDEEGRERHAHVLAGYVPRSEHDVTAPRGAGLPAVGRPDVQPLPEGWAATVEEIRQRSQQPWLAAPSGQGAAALGVRVDAGESLELPTEVQARRQRGGASLGTAVHAVLDIAVRRGSLSEDELVEQAASACADEDIPDHAAEVAQRVRAALSTDLMREVLASDHRWPELYLSAPVDEDGIRLVEGFADVVFEAADGLVIIDYKTDGVITPENRLHYAEQLGAYAVLLERITGRPVVRRLILHLPGESEAHVL